MQTKTALTSEQKSMGIRVAFGGLKGDAKRVGRLAGLAIAVGIATMALSDAVKGDVLKDPWGAGKNQTTQSKKVLYFSANPGYDRTYYGSIIPWSSIMRASVYGLSVKTIFWLIFLLWTFVGICVQVYFPDVGAVIIGVLRGIGLAIVRGVYSPEELLK